MYIVYMYILHFYCNSARVTVCQPYSNTQYGVNFIVVNRIFVLQTILKPNNFNGMDMFKEWKRGDYQKKL